jgi:hypothetical protein
VSGLLEGDADGPGALAHAVYFAGGVVFDGSVDLVVAAGGGFDGEVVVGAPAAGVDPDAPVGGHVIGGVVLDGGSAGSGGVADGEGLGDGAGGVEFPAAVFGEGFV